MRCSEQAARKRGFTMKTQLGWRAVRSRTRALDASRQIHSYAELQKKLHEDLLAQHPEWIGPDGNCPKCEEYDRMLAETISRFKGAHAHA
jgi:hypothetical protein